MPPPLAPLSPLSPWVRTHRATPPMHGAATSLNARLLPDPAPDTTAVVGCIDVLEKGVDSLTLSWKQPVAIGRGADQYHLELATCSDADHEFETRAAGFISTMRAAGKRVASTDCKAGPAAACAGGVPVNAAAIALVALGTGADGGVSASPSPEASPMPDILQRLPLGDALDDNPMRGVSRKQTPGGLSTASSESAMSTDDQDAGAKYAKHQLEKAIERRQDQPGEQQHQRVAEEEEQLQRHRRHLQQQQLQGKEQHAQVERRQLRHGQAVADDVTAPPESVEAPPPPACARTGRPANCSSGSWSWREVASGMHRVHLVAGLSSCTSYRLRLRVDRDNSSYYGAVAETATYCPPPQLPPVRVACPTADGALLAWDECPDAPEVATSYELYGRGVSDTAARQLWKGPGRQFWLRGREPGEELALSVVSSSPTLGGSVGSNESLLTVPQENPFRVPAQRPPVTRTGFGLLWTAPPRCSTRPLTYKVMRSGPLLDAAPPPPEEVLACRGAATSCRVEGLPAGSDHHVQVFAYEGGELVHSSAVATLTTLPSEPQQPHPPRLLEATDTALRMGWLPPEHDRGAAVQSYQLTLAAATAIGTTWEDLDQAPGACAEHPELVVPYAVGWHCAREGVVPPPRLSGWSVVYDGGAEAFTATGLEPAATYHFRLRALNRMGASLWSHAATVRTLAGRPGAVARLRQTGTYTRSARVAWERAAPRGAPVRGYQLQALPLNISGGGEGRTSLAWQDAVRAAADAARAANASWRTRYEGNDTTAEVEGLPPNGVTLMRVRALSSLGEGDWGAELHALTKALVFPKPDPPLASVQGFTSAKLSWSTPTKTPGMAPMLFHHVRCSLVAATLCSPPPPPPPAELTTPTPLASPDASPDASPGDFPDEAPAEPAAVPTPTPTPVRQPDIRFDAGWIAPKPAAAATGAARASAFAPWPTAEQPSPLQKPGAPQRQLNSVEVAQQGTTVAPPAGQGKTVYMGAATQAVLPELLSGGKYACTLTVTNLVGESEPSDPVHFGLPPPLGCSPEPSPVPSPETFADALSRAMRQRKDDEQKVEPPAADDGLVRDARSWSWQSVKLGGGSDAARHGTIALVQEAAAPDRDAEYSP